MKQEVREYIDETAKAMLGENLMQAALAGANFYAATEALLRSYKKLQQQVEDVDDYGFIPPQKSKSITIAPPSGGAMLDWSEVRDEAIRERMRSYVRSNAQYENIDRIVRQYESNPYFIVIRMYYFGEDAEGNDLPNDGRQRTMEDIANELSEVGFKHSKSDKTLAKKKTEIVRDMTVTLFGEAGAVSIEMYKARKASRIKGEQNE